MLSRRTLLAWAGALALGGAVGCGTDARSTLERAAGTGVLRIGIAGEQPYGYLDADGRVTGAQPEVARAVLATIGVGGLEAVQVPFDRLIPGLRAAQFDVIAAGMAVRPSRFGEVAFSRPDFLAQPAFLVRRGNPRRIATYDDVARTGARLGVLAGAAEREYALSAGVPEDRIEEFGGQGDMLRATAAGGVTAGTLTALSLRDELRRNPGSRLEVTDPFTPVLGGRPVVPAGAFGVRPADTGLLAAVDGALAALQGSGEWLRITAPFGFTDADVPPRDLTTASLCAP